jgi:hypothetical protein
MRTSDPSRHGAGAFRLPDRAAATRARWLRCSDVSQYFPPPDGQQQPYQPWPQPPPPPGGQPPYQPWPQSPATGHQPGQPWPQPPTTGQQPGLPWSPQPAPRRGRAKVTLIVASVVLVVFCLGGGVAGYFLLRDSGGGGGADSPREAVSAFLDRMKADDLPGAYAQLCPATRAKASYDKFMEGADEQKLRDYELGPVQTTTSGGRTTAVVNVTLRFTDGEEDTAQIPTEEVDDRWWVCIDAL